MMHFTHHAYHVLDASGAKHSAICAISKALANLVQTSKLCSGISLYWSTAAPTQSRSWSILSVLTITRNL